ncbi:hypothetical protein CSHISOI_07204 [Colletotrichum shisoi]|uniref:Uncharacterized protein n=1 Tax=Colletotrichum shisoi TaxID=2078593 RepID=A0A5Q4BML7_9PEZI|nr:hypothetical protein CSHISOI_07204 [Colletotrichum shisoi]
MEPTTVVGAVSALTELFADGAEHYAHWKRNRAVGNHYCRTTGSGGQRDIINCALSASLGASGHQIKQTYDAGFAILGAEFSMGDDGDNVDGDNDDDDKMTTAMTIATDQAPFQSEPPSPPPTPPTPKPTGSDAASLFAASEAGASSAGTFLLRPKVSVFSMFCPEAMTFQVNLSKNIPETPKRCKCGYRWKALLPENKDFVVLKEGFRMSSRFLAKSHSDRNKFACCLCVPSGKTDKYESAEALQAHINLSHTKWQMLHDRDIS